MKTPLSVACRTRVDVSSRGADLFIKNYYKLIDTQRHTLTKLYKETSAILWNGNAFSGSAPFLQFYTGLPPTSHDIQSYDCQPILYNTNLASNTSTSVLVQVNGLVSYGGGLAKAFAQTFILVPSAAGATYFIGSDCFRFV